LIGKAAYASANVLAPWQPSQSRAAPLQLSVDFTKAARALASCCRLAGSILRHGTSFDLAKHSKMAMEAA
jgi:hypothetical protein